MSQHDKYGGSTAGRTLNCHAWQHLSADMPQGPSSAAAELGTSLHEVIEKCLLDPDLDPYSFADTTVIGVHLTKQHITDKIYPALDEFDILMDKYDIDRYWVEERVKYADDIGGTADFIGLSADGKTVIVADYKSGDGLMVYAQDNAQGLFYAMCAQHKVFRKIFADAENLVIGIVQPSHRRQEYLDVWETDFDVLADFADEHDAAVIVAERGDSEPVIGSWCAFCPAESTCPAKLKEVAKIEFIPEDTKLAEELSEALVIADKVESWVKAVRKTAHEMLSTGTDIKNFKLVEKRATRVWNDVEAVEKKVKLARKIKVADAYDTKLKSPPQMEKVCNELGIDWEDYNEFVSCVSSGTTLVSAHDPRQAVLISSTQKMLAERFAQ